MALTPQGERLLTGVWWPQSRDLDVEIADLVENFPQAGCVSRVLFSRPDWATAPHWVPLKGGRLKVGSFPDHDTHVVVLSMTDHTTCCLLVIPPDHHLGATLLITNIAGQPAAVAHELLDRVV